jgi:hypothetical protein
MAESVQILILDESLHVPAAELSRLLGISDTVTNRLARSGVFSRIQDPRNKKAYLYPLVDCVRSFSQLQRSEREKAQTDFLSEKSKTQAAIRAKAELAMERSRGDLIPREEFLSTFGRAVRSYQQKMSTFASRVIERLSHTSERASQLAILEAESADALDSLADILARASANGHSQEKRKAW